MNSLGLFQHAGSKNHGCEALVKTTFELFKTKTDSFFVVTGNSEEDSSYIKNDKITIYDRRNIKKNTFEYIKYAIKYRLKISFSTFPICTWQIKEKDYLAISIGGDNYCYLGYKWLTDDLISTHNWLIKHHKKTVLWGCSIEEETLQNKELLNDLRKYDLITVRESLSKENLAYYGIVDNVVETVDSAFILETEQVDNYASLFNNNKEVVGINISPLVIEKNEKVLDNYIKLIDYIMNNTEFNVALIPHVVWKGNDDRESNDLLFEKFEDTGRIIKIEDNNCEKLKGYIANCRFFVGARTHATIAAYSSEVPTIVIGYSIKSKGIANDLFGEYDNYVLDSSGLKDNKELTNSFKWLMKNENIIKNKLHIVLPRYKNKVYEARDKVIELMEK